VLPKKENSVCNNKSIKTEKLQTKNKGKREPDEIEVRSIVQKINARFKK